MTLSRLFNSQATTVTRAAGFLFLSMGISTLLALLRDGLLSWRFGPGETTDIYFAAFRIPDFLSTLFIMGGISVVFVPLFSEYFRKDSREAWEFTNNLLNIVALMLVVLAILAFLLAPLLINLIVSGFSPEQKTATVALTRLMLASPILFGISAIFSGVLQYFRKFLAYSLAPVLYNLGIIAGILFLYPVFGMLGLGLGVLGGALFHVGIQIPAVLQSGFRWQPIFRFRHPAIARALGLAFPRTIAALGFHINLLVVTALASTISIGSITIFTFANNLQHIPSSLVGISFALASFPVLSRLFVQQDGTIFRETFSRALRQIIFFVAPVSVLFFLLRTPLIRLIYGAGEKFDWEATRLTGAALGIFAFGILFYALLPLFVRTFFAVQDTKTPTLASFLGIGLNIILAIVFLRVFAYQGFFKDLTAAILKLGDIDDIRILALPLALVVSAAIQFFVLLFLFAKKIQGVINKELILFVGKTFFSSLVLGVVAYIILWVSGEIFALRTYREVLGQIMLASVGGIASYLMAAYILKFPEAQNLLRIVTAHWHGKPHS